MEDDTRLSSVTGMSRRHFVVGGASFMFAAGSTTGLAATPAPIRFGLTPVFLNNDIQLLDLLRSYLERETGFAVELVTRRTYQEVTTLLVSGQLDAAWICGYPFIQFRNELSLLAIPQWKGKPLYQSYLIVMDNRDVRSLLELGGDIHAFSDPDSNSGFLATRSLMFGQGLDPETFFRKTLFTYGHRNVIRAVASGLVQSGSVDGYVWEVMLELEPELVSRTKVLNRSDWFGFPPVATSRKLAETAKTIALQRALVGMPDNAAGREILGMLKLTGFQMPQSEIYDGIANMVARLRGVL